GFVDHTHPALAETLLELVTAIKDGLTCNRRSGFCRVIRAESNIVGETGATGWTLFHPMVLQLTTINPARVKTFAKKILAVDVKAGKKLFQSTDVSTGSDRDRLTVLPLR